MQITAWKMNKTWVGNSPMKRRWCEIRSLSPLRRPDVWQEVHTAVNKQEWHPSTFELYESLFLVRSPCFTVLFWMLGCKHWVPVWRLCSLEDVGLAGRNESLEVNLWWLLVQTLVPAVSCSLTAITWTAAILPCLPYWDGLESSEPMSPNNHFHP